MSPNRLKYLGDVVAYHRAQADKTGFWETGMDHVEGSYDAITRTAGELLKAAELVPELVDQLTRIRNSCQEMLDGADCDPYDMAEAIRDGASEVLAKLEGP